MCARRFGVATKVNQVVLEDLEAWHQQLYEDHHAVVRYEVFDPPSHWGVRPAVRCRVVRAGVGKEERTLWEDYRTVVPTEMGCLEAAMLALVSKALLELENEKALAERRQPPLWAQ